MIADSTLHNEKDLAVYIKAKPAFYSLYADGVFQAKLLCKNTGDTALIYPKDSVLALYYTYPAFRSASLIRNAAPAGVCLPGLSKPVYEIFHVRASKVDKLRRAIAFYNKNYGGAFNFKDDFYIRLYFILEKRGKLDYAALQTLALKFT